MDRSSTYDPSFYRHEDKELSHASEVIAPFIVGFCHPQSVLDVGCGTGRLLAAFRSSGVADLTGVEGEWLDRRALRIPEDRVQTRDLSLAFDLGRRFDLAVCTEVGEHLPKAAAPTLVESLVRHSDLVAFSAAIPFQGGKGHVNERWPEYWAQLFGQHGYAAFDCLRPRLWGEVRVPYYYRQNLVMYARRSSEAEARIQRAISEAGPPPAPLPLVHPDRYLDTYTSWKGLIHAARLAARNLIAVRRTQARQTSPSERRGE